MQEDAQIYRTVEHLVRGQISRSMSKNFNLDYVFHFFTQLDF